MKIRNNSERNISLNGTHTTDHRQTKRILFPAGSTLTIADEEWDEVKLSAKDFLKLGILEILETPESSLTKEEIAKKILTEASIKVDITNRSKRQVQALAESLDIEV